MVRCALVLEGGGCRGIFTAGVLDSLLEAGLTQFDCVYGTSSGALNAANFKARQHGRFMRDVLAFHADRRFMSLSLLAKTGSIVGDDFVYSELQNVIDPFDYATFSANPMKMFAVATDVLFGTPTYLRVEELPRDMDMIRASASLPGMSRMVAIDHHRYLDGGTVDSVAVEKALDDGADRVLVVLTRERGFVKEPGLERHSAITHQYTNYPYYLTALKNHCDSYNNQRKRIYELEKKGCVTIVAPSEPVVLDGISGTGEQLLRLYLSGHLAGQDMLSDIRNIFS